MTIVIENPSVPSPSSPSVTIYPNPAIDAIKLKFENREQGPTAVNIHDMAGKLIHTVYVNVETEIVDVKLPNLAPGFYFVNITSKNIVSSHKLLIQPK